MNTLITGGSGFFGSFLVKRLIQKSFSCKVFDLYEAPDKLESVEFIKGDIRDYNSVLLACKDVDIIHHNIAQVPLVKDKKLFNSVNVQGTRNILKAALESNVKKIVYTSSSAVFGIPENNPVAANTEPNPLEAYGKAKYEAELICREYIDKGLDITIIRPRTIMGKGRLGIFQILFEWIRTGNNIPVLGGGNNKYQFIHASDLADACILASQKKGSSVYNCGTDRFGTMKEVLENLCEHAKTGSRIKSIPMRLAIILMNITSLLRLSPLGPYHSLMYGRSLYFDVEKIQRELDWKPKYSNNEMFIESYDWYLNNSDKTTFHSNEMSHHRSAIKEGILKLVKWLL